MSDHVLHQRCRTARSVDLRVFSEPAPLTSISRCQPKLRPRCCRPSHSTRGAHDCGLRATAASFSLPPSLARVHRTAVSPSARQSVSRSLVRSFVRAPPLQRTCAPVCSTVETVLVCMRCCTAPLSLSVYTTRTVLQHCSFRPAVSAGGKSGTARPSFDRSFRSCAAPLLSSPSLARPEAVIRSQREQQQERKRKETPRQRSHRPTRRSVAD